MPTVEPLLLHFIAVTFRCDFIDHAILKFHISRFLVVYCKFAGSQLVKISSRCTTRQAQELTVVRRHKLHQGDELS